MREFGSWAWMGTSPYRVSASSSVPLFVRVDVDVPPHLPSGSRGAGCRGARLQGHPRARPSAAARAWGLGRAPAPRASPARCEAGVGSSQWLSARRARVRATRSAPTARAPPHHRARARGRAAREVWREAPGAPRAARLAARTAAPISAARRLRGGERQGGRGEGGENRPVEAEERDGHATTRKKSRRSQRSIQLQLRGTPLRRGAARSRGQLEHRGDKESRDPRPPRQREATGRDAAVAATSTFPRHRIPTSPSTRGAGGTVARSPRRAQLVPSPISRRARRGRCLRGGPTGWRRRPRSRGARCAGGRARRARGRVAPAPLVS